jgi:hypothetical protein
VLAAGRPAAIGQLGRPECRALAAHLGLREFYKYTWASVSYSDAGLPEAGVFPATDEIYWRFSELLLERIALFDGFALQHHVGESAIIANRCSGARRLASRALEPYLFAAPWTAQLAGKRVLVIHPFETSIRAQFGRRAAIWPQPPNLLPEFQMNIARAPLGFSRSGFNDWLAMVRWFEDRVAAIYQRTPFDVALVGCGACGIPLTALVKKLGAIGIHLGEVTPILFGIRDGAWDKQPEHQRFLSPAWVDPQPSELPAAFSR